MAAKPLVVLVVGDEKELDGFEAALEACKKTVGPIKFFSAHKAVDAVGRIQKALQVAGVCHGALLSHHFTAPGKEEFSDTLRKVLKEKYSTVPIVCWGHVTKGGEQGKHYHYGVEYHGPSDAPALAKALNMLKSGEIKAEYHSKKKSMDKGSKKASADETRKSTDHGAKPRPSTDSPLRRRSLEGESAPRRSSASRFEEEAKPARNNSTTQMKSGQSMSSMSPMGMGMGGMSSFGQLGMGMDSGGMGSLGSMSNYNGMGMGMMGMGMSPMGMGMGSLGMGMSPDMGAAGSMGGMGGFSNGMGGMGAGLTPMSPGMGGMMGGMGAPSSLSMGSMFSPGMGGDFSGGMSPMAAAPPPTPSTPTPSLLQPSMEASIGGMVSALPTTGPSPSTVADLSSQMAAVSMAGASPAPAAAAPAGATPNTDLIKMLAEEVVRLRKLVQEKRAKQSTPSPAAAPVPDAIAAVAAGIVV
mmetsp:Transcript_6346/g.14052  ORF Transcript_6346/g.14052 Transcript_6346/m.14052 type:complete len:468 (-) Transcript_6346:1499-2902(-)|eukprot:CAMPEP_0202900494 /NCGR_PEP_ID=MMETSP1392-20130828/11864_1 /ASSEMBLY_ACC=CAM_ASM_000868 /TAXON_ID=225041 /ORGANISM="Chlamydomonas chlamydogama, Strain SAG 11-48b" /LENGTH=467 /DNA_ID=CAMNT_0049586891 /DNA_START=112 /DNA_END=1515 /DNA_ORIENTATION=+